MWRVETDLTWHFTLSLSETLHHPFSSPLVVNSEICSVCHTCTPTVILERWPELFCPLIISLYTKFSILFSVGLIPWHFIARGDELEVHIGLPYKLLLLQWLRWFTAFQHPALSDVTIHLPSTDFDSQGTRKLSVGYCVPTRFVFHFTPQECRLASFIEDLTYLLTYLRSWALLEKLPIVQPLKNFPAF
jgi:hypothetical protein